MRKILTVTLFAIMLAASFLPTTSHAQTSTQAESNTSETTSPTLSAVEMQKLESMSLDIDVSNPESQEQTV